MKTTLKIFALLLFPVSMTAQECVSWYPVQNGNVWEMSHYDKKDKLTGTTLSTITGIETVSNGFSATVLAKSADEKGKETGTATMVLKCADGVFLYDMKNFMDPSTMESYKDMEVSVEASDMQFPATLSAGQKLPDASITYTVKMNGMTIMTMVINITNRVVQGQESITTPAGTFDAWKISFTVDSKAGIGKTHFNCVDYLSVGAGVVKTQSFNEKGDLVSYSVLTKLIR